MPKTSRHVNPVLRGPLQRRTNLTVREAALVFLMSTNTRRSRPRGDTITIGKIMKALYGLAVVCALCASAQAPASEAQSTPVQYGDLNLNAAAGVKALYTRLEHAAVIVCEGYSAPARELARAVKYKACISEAITQAVKKVDRPQLTKYATEKLYPARRSTGVAKE